MASNGATRIPYSVDGKASHLSAQRSRGVFVEYAWGRLSAGSLLFLSGLDPTTRPGHRVLIPIDQFAQLYTALNECQASDIFG